MSDHENKKVVLFDIDGVLTNFLGHWLNYINVYSGFDLKEEDVTHWNLGKTKVIADLHMTKERQKQVFYDIFDIPGFWNSMPLFHGARDFVKYFPWRHKLVLVSAPSGSNSAKEKTEYVKRVFGTVPLILTEHKEYVRGDIFVDDYPKNCVDWLLANPKGMAYCPDTPYRSIELEKAFDSSYKNIEVKDRLILISKMTEPNAFQNLRNIVTHNDPMDDD